MIRGLMNWISRIHAKTNMRFTLGRYKRVNPPYEDVLDWKQRGALVFPQSKNVTLYNSAAVGGDVSVGDNCWIGPFVCLDGSGGLTIGDHCSISTGVQVLTHDTVDWALTGGKQPYSRSPVTIGNHCFIGTGAVVLKGVNIGHHCVIGANSVVNKSIPDNAIASGNPATIIGRIEILANGTVKKHFNL